MTDFRNSAFSVFPAVKFVVHSWLFAFIIFKISALFACPSPPKKTAEEIVNLDKAHERPFFVPEVENPFFHGAANFLPWRCKFPLPN